MKSRKLAYALAISVISLLTGCGSSGNSNNNGPGNIIGCAQYNNAGACITPIYGTTGGCVPISSPIYFAGSGQFLGSVLAAGTIPNYGQSYGTLSVTNTPIANIGGQTYTSTSGLSINVANNYGGTQTSVSGSLNLSQAAQYNILMTSQGSSPYAGAWGSSFYGSPYGTGYGSSACVSGLALQLASYSSVNGVYGYAYLYLNNTQHGYVLQLY